MSEIVYLGSADVERCAIEGTAVLDAVRAAFLAQRSVASSLHLRIDPARKLTARAGALPERGVAAVKWFGVFGANAARGEREYDPLIVLSELDVGVPLAVIDGRWITDVRTAAVSTVAAQSLAPNARSLALLGSGRSANAHLDMLSLALPLERVVVFGRNDATAARLVETARTRGLEANTTTDPRFAADGADIVISTIPRAGAGEGFVDTHWLAPNAFASLVDLGFAWLPATFRTFDRIVGVEIDKATRRSFDPLAFDGEFDTDLASVLAAPPREAGRSALIFGGCGLGDVAVATLVYERGRLLGLGQRLPR